MKTLVNVLFLALIALSASEASAAATCFCKISWHDLRWQVSASGVALDLTGAVGKAYTGPFQLSEGNQQNCASLCAAQALPYVKSQSLANSACAASAPHDSKLTAYSAVGTKPYREVLHNGKPVYMGQLVNQPQVASTTCTCPAGWMANPTNVPGGVTTDGQCKKMAAQP